jgi:transposase InsO family protein
MTRLDIYRSITALAETVNGLYKAELIYRPDQGPWRSIEEVELATLEWVHWYNHQRLHSHCGIWLRAPPPPGEETSATALSVTERIHVSGSGDRAATIAAPPDSM